jgi:hypothetical protein
MKTPIGLNSKGNKSSLNVCSTYDHVFSWITIIVTCVVIVNVCHILFVWIGSTTTSMKVWKLSLVIRVSTPHWVWRRKMRETSLWTCVSLSKIIVMIISRNASWVVICSFLQGHQSKWVPRSLMIWPHWHYERWVAIVCGKPRRICNAARKWVKDRRNASAVRQVNNQTPTFQPTHEWKHALHDIWRSIY